MRTGSLKRLRLRRTPAQPGRSSRDASASLLLARPSQARTGTPCAPLPCWRASAHAGEKRLQEHLQFLLTNLSYEHESGREAALDMLTVVLQKFPEQLVSQWAEMVRCPGREGALCARWGCGGLRSLLEPCWRAARVCLGAASGGIIALQAATQSGVPTGAPSLL